MESDINSLEHHGLNRCLDVGWSGYQRYVGYGVLSYNLHVIGRELQARARARSETVRAAAWKSLLSDEPLKPDRSSVAEPGDFGGWREFKPSPTPKPSPAVFPAASLLYSTPKNRSFRPDTNYRKFLL